VDSPPQVQLSVRELIAVPGAHWTGILLAASTPTRAFAIAERTCSSGCRFASRTASVWMA
jgi:hypothetical protein